MSDVTKNMTVKDFETNLMTYGTDLSRWPDEKRDAVAKAIEASPTAQHQINSNKLNQKRIGSLSHSP